MKRIDLKWDIEGADLEKERITGKITVFVGDSFLDMREDSTIAEITVGRNSVGVSGLPACLSGREIDIIFKSASVFHNGFFKKDLVYIWSMADGRIT